MSQRLLSLAPFRGLDTSMVQQPAGQGTPMVGGYNVEVVGGEWWVRKGHSMEFRQPTGSQPFGRILYGGASARAFIVSPWAVLRYNSSADNFTEAYAANLTESATFTNGSAAVTTTTNANADGDMVLVTAGATTEVYRIASGGGTTSITLDRVYTGSSGAKSTRFYRFLLDTVDYSTDYATSPADALIEAVIIEQTVAHTATAVHAASPATTAGRKYLILTSVGLGTDGKPVAIDVTNLAAAPLRDWFYTTGASSPASITSSGARAKFCEVFKRCLFIAGGSDPTGTSDNIVVYYSRPNDFLLWHDGVQGGSYNHRFLVFEGDDDENPIVGMKALGGEQLIVYRRYSIENVFATGSIFDYTSYPAGLKIIANSIAPVTIAGQPAHLLMTNRGPAVCDGRAVTPIAEAQLTEFLREFSLNDTAPDVIGTLHESTRSRVTWALSGRGAPIRHQSASIPATGTQAYTGNTYDTVATAIVYDYAAGVVWLEDHINWTAGAEIRGDSIVVRPDGSIAQVYRHTSGKDGAVLYTSTDVSVDALAETPWLPLNGGQWATASNAIVELRALNAGTASDNDIADLWALSSETLHLATLEFYTDFEMTVRYTAGCSILVSDMLALVSEGERALPLIPFNVALEGVAGTHVKVRIKNAGGSGSHTKGHFRLANLTFWGDPGEDFVPRNARAGAAL